MRLASLPPLAMLTLLGGCFDTTPPSSPDAARPVQVVVVHTTAPEDTRTYSGIVAPRREATLGFRVGGRIDARLVDVGAVVTDGQVLARLDPTDFALSVRSARSDLDSAHAQEAQATAEAARYGALVHLGHVSASDNDQRQASASVAHAHAAVVGSTVRRARPVVLTALAAVLAFVPLSLNVFWGPMAIAMIGGLLVATALTLVFLPALTAIVLAVPQEARGAAPGPRQRRAFAIQDLS